MILFHVSPKRLKLLRPEKSQTAYSRVFLCEFERLEWAIEHTARRHNVTRHRLYVHAVRFKIGSWPKMIKPGIYATYQELIAIARWRLK